MRKNAFITSLASIAILSLAMTGCGTSPGTTTGTPDGKQISAEAPNLRVESAWVKAAAQGMSAAFGTLHNGSDADVTVVSAVSSASPMVELHETVMGTDGTMKMQVRKDGFTIPAHSTLALEPGGNHLMMMGLTQEIKAGEEIDFALTLKDGRTVEFMAPAKAFSGAKESYHEGGTPTAQPSDSHQH